MPTTFGGVRTPVPPEPTVPSGRAPLDDVSECASPSGGAGVGGRAVPPAAWQVVLTVLLALWIVAVTSSSQVIGYGIDQYFLLTEGRLAPAWMAASLAVLGGAFAAGPAALLAWLPRTPALRAIGRAWVLAGTVLATLGLARFVPIERHEAYLGTLTVTAVVFVLVIRRLNATGAATRHDTPDQAGSAHGSGRARVPIAPRVAGAGVAGGLLTLLPWVLFGALGGLTETVLALAAALAIGWLANNLVSTIAFSGSWSVRVLVGGLVTGIALTPLAAAVGGSGTSLLSLIVIPTLGFAVAALGTHHGRSGALIGLAAAGPLLFVDPEETSVLLGTQDIARWAMAAAVGAVCLGFLVDLGYGLSYGRQALPRRLLVAATVPLVAAGVAAVHLGAGQPGLHGERLFVVLNQQADLTGVAAIADRGQRLRETYRRLVDTAERTQGPLRKGLARLHLSYRPYYLVNGLEVDGGPVVRAWLASRSEVNRVLLNPTLRPLPATQRPEVGVTRATAGPEWNVKLIGADHVWEEYGVRGAGIVVGTSDSGVDAEHPALSDGFRGGDDSWYDPWNGAARPVDHNGHGTHTLGTAVGADGIGVAPDARWIGCVNLDRNLGSPSRYLDCLQFMLAPFPRGGDPLRDGRPERAPHVLTNSWGCPSVEGCDGQVLRPAVAALAAAGIFFVVSAGNTGPSCRSLVDDPAPVPEAFTVGAVDATRRVASFSSRGPAVGAAKPDLVAPGVDVRSALPEGGYGEMAGTSMAAPHVAGVVALMWSANPRLIGDMRRTAEILRATAQPAAATFRPHDQECGGATNITGAGIVDAHAAVRVALAA